MPHALQAVAELTGHTDRTWSASWNPARPLLASCSGDRTVRLYSYDSKGTRFTPLATLANAHKGTIRNLDWHPRGKVLATASFDSTIGIWEQVRENGIEDGEGMMEEDEAPDADAEWECSTTLEGHENEVKSVRWSAKGDLLATCGRDKSVWVWEALASGDFECLAVIMDHTQDVKSVAWHPNHEILASASYDDTMRLYRPEDDTDDWISTHVLPPPPVSHHAHAHAPGEPCSSSGSAPSPAAGLGGHDSTVWACAWSPCGRYLASCSDDRTVRIWRRDFLEGDELPDLRRTFRIGPTEKERWPCVLVIEGHHDRAIFAVDWCESDATQKERDASGSLGWLASTGGDGKICVYELFAKAEAEQAKNRPDISYTTLATIEDAHSVYDINSVAWCRYRPLEEEKWRSARRLLATTGDDGAVRIWRLEG